MADPADFQQRLNTDPQLRQAFLDDPLGVLQQEGFPPLVQQDAQDLLDLIAQVNSANPPPSGSSVHPTGYPTAIAIFI